MNDERENERKAATQAQDSGAMADAGALRSGVEAARDGMRRAGEANPESRVREAVRRWAEGIQKKNAEEVLGCVGISSVRFLLAPPLQADMPLLDNLEAWFETFEGEIGYEVRGLAVHVASGVAYAHGFAHLTGRKKDGRYVDLWFRFTLGLLKAHEEWKIAHMHESVPFLMDGTERAVLHLLPPVSTP
ncbi:MAG TPA: nuclear transport factor 2 family protein [Prosthecobacter sp.]